VAVAGLIVAVCCGACREPSASGKSAASKHPGWPEELRFAIGVNPHDEETALLNDPFGKRIEAATGLRVTFFNGTNFSSVVEAMRAKRIEGMQTGVFSYLLAEKVAGAEAIAVYVTSYANPPVYDAQLRSEYNGIIVVKKGSNIRTIRDLRGRTLNFGDPAGTSDHLVPKTELLKAGLAADRDVKTTFAGNHAAALVSLWNGKADAAATADSAVRHFASQLGIGYCGFPDSEMGHAHSQAELTRVYDACPAGKIVAIHSVQIPGTPFALRGDLPADLKETIRRSLLSTPGDPEFIRAAKRWYVDPAVDLKLPNIFTYYDSTREMAKLLDLDLTRLK
jgi:phosphonate transport system substrate-binding protein